MRNDGYTVISGPRTTGDGYYESCIVGIEGNQIEITEWQISICMAVRLIIICGGYNLNEIRKCRIETYWKNRGYI